MLDHHIITLGIVLSFTAICVVGYNIVRRFREKPFERSSKPMIEMLDLGVIMSSSAQWVFEDMVERYPGAKYFFENFKSRHDNPENARREMQSNLAHLFDGDKELCARFFEKLSYYETQPTTEQIRQKLNDGLGIVVTDGQQRSAEDDEIRKHLEELFPGMKVIRLDLEPD